MFKENYKKITLAVFVLAVLILGFTPLNSLYGRSDIYIITAVLGAVFMWTGFKINSIKLSFAVSLGYVLSFICGYFLSSKPPVYSGKVYPFWYVWLLGYFLFIGVCFWVYCADKVIKKNKKYIFVLLLFSVLNSMLVVIYSNKTTTTDEIISYMPSFKGQVSEVYDSSILVKVNDGEDERNSSDLISVSLNVEYKDLSPSQIEVNDTVTVYYDGYILESYPAQLSKVYGIAVQ